MHKITTPLIIATVKEQLKTLSKLVVAGKTLELDLSEVQSIDSAGLAMLLELKKTAISRKCKLTITNTTDFFTRMCSLYQITF